MQVLYRIRVSRHMRGFGNQGCFLGFPIVMTIVFWAICVGPTLTEALISRLVQDFESIRSCSKLPNTLIFLSSAKFHIRNILAMCNIELVPSNVQNIRGHILRKAKRFCLKWVPCSSLVGWPVKVAPLLLSYSYSESDFQCPAFEGSHINPFPLTRSTPNRETIYIYIHVHTYVYVYLFLSTYTYTYVRMFIYSAVKGYGEYLFYDIL